MQPNFQKGEHESDASHHRQQQHDDGDVHVQHVHDDARPKNRLALFSPHLTVDCYNDLLSGPENFAGFPGLFYFARTAFERNADR